MRTEKKLAAFACACAAAFTSAAEFGVANVEAHQGSDSRQVRISYDLKDVPAIITVDVKTNGSSIGTANITHLSGDVNKIVTKTGQRCTAYWQADKSWPDHLITDGSVTIDVVAWATNRPPDYCTVNLKNGDVRYYTASDQLPGGGVTNAIYKSDYLAMRYIAAAGVPWYMGSTNELGRQAKRETYQQVTLTNDFYIGVYQFTQAQWKKFFANTSAYGGDLQPVESMDFGYLRESSDGAADPDYEYPLPPNRASLMGQLRSLTGHQLSFDLPSEAQWEYACRAGTTEGYWNDGSEILSASGRDANLDNLAYYNASKPTDVGTKNPNRWGLYDMHGNIREVCLDYYVPCYIYPTGHGEVQTSKELSVSSATEASGGYHVLKGGQAATGNCFYLRSAARSWKVGHNNQDGFRVVAVLP